MSLGRMASNSSGTALSTLARVTSVDALKNISSNVMRKLDCSKTIRKAIQSISRKECFARLDYIERLSINDVAMLFQYAAAADLDDFDKQKFLDDQTQIVRSVITAIDMAVKVSRGSLTEGTKIISLKKRKEGDIDALRFVAVTRILVEWRNIRMVPKGYQRYAIAISLGYRDVLQNLEKIERGVHDYLRHHQKINEESNNDLASIPSPTMRQLLQFEARIQVHKRLPRLNDKSSASGFLWTKRQLHYLMECFKNSLEVPELYESAEDAARAAYTTVYDQYHGWAVKQIFLRSFNGSPPLDKIWLQVQPPSDFPRSLGDTNGKYKSSKNAKKDSMSFPPVARTYSDMNSTASITMSERTDRTINTHEDDNEVLVALDFLGHVIVEKWEDVIRMFNCGKEEKRKRQESLILSSESHFDLNQLNRDMVESSLQENTSEDMDDVNSVMTPPSPLAETIVCRQQAQDGLIRKSKQDTEDFVRGFAPMIADLGVLIEQMNMNDPSRA
jgi:hypothetical protein